MPYKDKAQQAANHAAWRKKNRERLLAKKRAWHEANRERRLEQFTEYNHSKVLPEYHAQKTQQEEMKVLQAIMSLPSDE